VKSGGCGRELILPFHGSYQPVELLNQPLFVKEDTFFQEKSSKFKKKLERKMIKWQGCPEYRFQNENTNFLRFILLDGQGL